MPAFNVEKFIESSILSVVGQTYQNWELIVINDGSTDKTKEIVEGQIRKDERIVLINQDNKKQAAARNAGIKVSNGEWIAFLDSDDIWLPSKLEAQVRHINTVDADLFFTGGQIVDENLENKMPYKSIDGFYSGFDMYNLLIKENVVPVLSVIFKAEWIKKVGQQDENHIIAGCEDWDYWLRMAISGATFYGMEEKLFYYRRHSNNMSGKSLQIAQAAVLLKNFTGNVGNKLEVRSNFKKVINPLITRLISEGRTTEATYLLKGMSNIGSGWNYAIDTLLVNFMGRYSAMPVRLLMRLNKLFSK